MSEVRSQFRREYDRELTRFLRRRFTWLCAAWLGLIVFTSTVSAVGWTFAPGGGHWPIGETLKGVGGAVILGFCLFFVRRRQPSQAHTLRLAHWMLIAISTLAILASLFPTLALNVTVFSDPSVDSGLQSLSTTNVITNLALMHLLVCLFLPWSPREAASPLLVIYPMWLVTALVQDGFTTAMVFNGFVFAPIVNAIGVQICRMRRERFREKVEIQALRRHFQESRRELFDARQIHETRFPGPIRNGAFRLNYDYEPMRQIGGDFLHAHTDPEGRLHVTLIDVTGHGVAAAITVNRLDGELRRVFGEDPSISPGEALTLINRYIFLTMSKHSIFATGIALRLAPDGRLDFANAGHPPAFVRRADGSVESLDSTTFMLGAAPPDLFDTETRTLDLAPGDCLIAYTDGVCEATDSRGRQLGLDGLTRIINGWRREAGVDLVPFIPNAVKAYRDGRAQDDVLVATVQRS
ncbi:MAG: PP2C family protein-serine/threonine phosphatase [Phycisphaerales bacterium]